MADAWQRALAGWVGQAWHRLAGACMDKAVAAGAFRVLERWC